MNRVRGLTILELVLLLGVVAVLAAVLVPNFMRARSRASTSCKSNLKNTATALEMYSVDNHGYYPANLAQLTPNYLKIVPNCPSTGSDTYSASYLSHCRPLEVSRVWCPHHEASLPDPRCQHKLDHLQDLSRAYSTRTGQPAPSLESLVDSPPSLLCPTGGGYELTTFEAAFTVFCAGKNHESSNTPANYPQYSSSQGLIER